MLEYTSSSLKTIAGGQMGLSKSGRFAAKVALVMIIINADLFLFLLIYYWQIPPFKAFVTSLFVGIPELPIWYWALSRIYQDYLNGSGSKKWNKKFDAVLHPNSSLGRVVLTVVEVFGLTGLFFLSSDPFPFGRTSCVVICVVTKWPIGLLPIILGNIVHLYVASIFFGRILN